MGKHFEILFLDEAFEFLSGLERKHYEKILYNIRKSQVELAPELFKKLSDDIWEFRTLYQGLQYRLLAFWDKTSTTDTLVISTHGFIKKGFNSYLCPSKNGRSSQYILVNFYYFFRRSHVLCYLYFSETKIAVFEPIYFAPSFRHFVEA